MRYELDLRHRHAQFRQAARHVKVGGDDDDALEAVLLGPFCRFLGVADRIGRFAADIGAALKQSRGCILRQHDFAVRRFWIDAGDQQAFGAVFLQQFKAFRHASAAVAGQHHDAVGVRAVILWFALRRRVGIHKKANRDGRCRRHEAVRDKVRCLSNQTGHLGYY